MAPGYAAGLGFYWRQFDALAPHFSLHAIDWLGTGLSGRPAFSARGREQTEAFFLESLRAWKSKMGVGKMVLMGHSLGGYLSACYALKYPEDVEHLILVCPAGVPQVPDDWQTRFQTMPTSRRMLFKTLMWTWDQGLTPGAVVRTLGPFGPGLCKGYVNSRFNRGGDGLTADEAAVFHRYFYQITAAPGSGEYALRHLLAPGAWAHAPLERRLHELSVPVTFVYGEGDWMRPEHAVNLCKRLREDGAPLCTSDKRVEIIDDAGHFVFLEQPALFNRSVIDACETVLGRAAARAAAHAMPRAAEQTHTAEMSRWAYRQGSGVDSGGGGKARAGMQVQAASRPRATRSAASDAAEQTCAGYVVCKSYRQGRGCGQPPRLRLLMGP